MRHAVLALLLCPAVAAGQPIRAPDDVCPRRLNVSPLIHLPVACPSPWAGVLYSPAEHARTRTLAARLDAAAIAERDRADVAHRALVACRVQRDGVTAACAVGAARAEGAALALDGMGAPERRASLWPWAALSGALAVAGAGAGSLAGRGAGEAIGYGIAGAAVGTVVALMVERWGR